MSGRLAGTGLLLRLALRRDRVRLLAWLYGVVVLAAYCAAALRLVYGDPADLRAVVGFVSGPAGTVLSGPGYGLGAPGGPTYGAALAGVYGMWVALGAAFAGMTLVVRHTRAEEESGRLELVRSGQVGAAAPLAVAGTLALGSAVGVAVLTSLPLVLLGYAPAPSVLFASGVAVVGLVFAALAAVTAQLVEHGRAALGLAAAGLAASVLVRGAGDVLEPGGSWLSWLSPIAWSQQTRAYVDDRWWPLALGLAAAVALGALAARLAGRRDLGAGLLASRPGSGRGGARLGTPLGLLARLERGAFLGWTAGLLVAGLLYGSLTASVTSSIGDLRSDLVLSVLGGDPDRLVDGYLGTVALVTALFGAAYAVSAGLRLVAEEGSGRLELLLSTAASRTAWQASALLLAAVGASVAVAAGGLGMGLGAAVSTGRWSWVPTLLGAHLAYLPGLWVTAAVAVLLPALDRRLAPAAWLVVVYAVVVGLLAGPLDLPGWLVDASPLGVVPLLPLESAEAAPLLGLTAVAAALGVLAVLRFRRRQVGV